MSAPACPLISVNGTVSHSQEQSDQDTTAPPHTSPPTQPRQITAGAYACRGQVTMSVITLPIYVRLNDDTEVHIGHLDVEPQISATTHLNPSALATIRNTIEPDQED